MGQECNPKAEHHSDESLVMGSPMHRHNKLGLESNTNCHHMGYDSNLEAEHHSAESLVMGSPMPQEGLELGLKLAQNSEQPRLGSVWSHESLSCRQAHCHDKSLCRRS